MKLLLAHCADSILNAVDPAGHTALSLAARNGSHQAVELLLARNPNLAGSLRVASAAGHDKVVKLLLAHRPDLGEVEQALDCAARHNHGEVVKLLLAASKQKLLQDDYLHQAIERGNYQLALVLVDEFARVKGGDDLCEQLTKRRGTRKLTILHHAIRSSRSNLTNTLVARLLEFQCRQTSVDQLMETTLHDAVRCAHLLPHTVAGVLAMDPTALRARNKFGHTPFDVAVTESRGSKVMEVLLWKVSFDDVEPHLALARDLLDKLVVRPLLLASMYSDVIDLVCEYITPFHASSREVRKGRESE